MRMSSANLPHLARVRVQHVALHRPACSSSVLNRSNNSKMPSTPSAMRSRTCDITVGRPTAWYGRRRVAVSGLGAAGLDAPATEGADIDEEALGWACQCGWVRGGVPNKLAAQPSSSSSASSAPQPPSTSGPPWLIIRRFFGNGARAGGLASEERGRARFRVVLGRLESRARSTWTPASSSLRRAAMSTGGRVHSNPSASTEAETKRGAQWS